ncbi:hypothetical protein M5K25_001978 [Dendrobium thyrsiflorum]|uniref:CCHC-type domain-containing protein n=1 Tax=Dendrobium thyrsiflorum TaxID=117978 RepID=A0ABD0VT80_DENTH
MDFSDGQSCSGHRSTISVNNLNSSDDTPKNVFNLRMPSTAPLSFKDPSLVKTPVNVPGKGKGIVDSCFSSSKKDGISKTYDGESSSSGMQLFVSKFGVTHIADSNIGAEPPTNNLADRDLVLEKEDNEENGLSTKNSAVNPWKKRPFIKVDLSKDTQFLSDDGAAVKLFIPNVEANTSKLKLSIVVKVFGRPIPIHIISNELRRQWSVYGKFHLTILGGGWILCSFFSEDVLEKVLIGGPWFVNGHIVGMYRWSPEFSTDSLKGLSSPVWVRMPNLPLFCWDEVNVARIASQIGMPLLIDGDMFQWGRREFARICVRMELDKPLPLGVWVQGLNGRFFQKMEYERISSLCFSCGKIGHAREACGVAKGNGDSVGEVNAGAKKVTLVNADSKCAVVGPPVSGSGKLDDSNNISVLEALSGVSMLVSEEGCSTVPKSFPNISVNLFTGPSSIASEDHLHGNRFSMLEVISEEGCSLGGITGSEILEEGELVVSPKGSPSASHKDLLIEVGNKDSISDKSRPGCSKPKLLKERNSLGPLNSSSRVKMKAAFNKETKISSINREEFDKWLGVADKGSCLVSTIYGSKGVDARRKLWEDLGMYSNSKLPFIWGGDFNCILSQNDKRGGKKFSFSIGPQEMKACLNQNDFHEVKFVGPAFTWCNNKKGTARILERLDRFFLNSKALEVFNQAIVRHLARIASDHCPLILNLFSKKSGPRRGTRFEDIWLSYPASASVVAKAWSKSAFGDDMEILNKKFYRTLKALHFWSRAKHLHLSSLKDKLKEEIEELQSQESLGNSFS